jgi:hypothetical protein
MGCLEENIRSEINRSALLETSCLYCSPPPLNEMFSVRCLFEPLDWFKSQFQLDDCSSFMPMTVFGGGGGSRRYGGNAAGDMAIEACDSQIEKRSLVGVSRF